jgi:hypothetical protein
MSQDIQQMFVKLCHQASEAYEKTGYNHRGEPVDAEPYLIELVNLVQSHPINVIRLCNFF